MRKYFVVTEVPKLKKINFFSETSLIWVFWKTTGLSPDLQSMEQIRRIMRPTDVPDQGLLCDLLWSDPDKGKQLTYIKAKYLKVKLLFLFQDVASWGENDRGVSFTFGADVVAKFLNKHDLDLICRAHQVKQSLFFCLKQIILLSFKV